MLGGLWNASELWIVMWVIFFSFGSGVWTWDMERGDLVCIWLGFFSVVDLHRQT